MDSEPPVTLPPGLAGRYDPVRRLGSGGFGHVVLVRDRELNRPVALKLSRALDLAPAPRARFEREATLTARVQHPHVVRLYDFGLEDGQAWLAYEYVEGADLAAVLARGVPPDLRTWLGWARQGTEALAALHREKILHRDVKPANLLVRGDGSLLLGDLGLAKLDASGQTLTATGAVAGTPRYIAPELWQGAEASPASDQYSWGIVLAELLVGPRAVLCRPPRPVPRPADLPPRLAPFFELVERAADPEPARRFAGMEELAAALGRAEAGAGSALVGPAPWDPGHLPRSVDGKAPTVARAWDRGPPAGGEGRGRLGPVVLAAAVTLGAGWLWGGRGGGEAGSGGGAGAATVPALAAGEAEGRELLAAAGKLGRAFAVEGIAEEALGTVELRSEPVRRVLRDPRFHLLWNRLAGRAVEWVRALRQDRSTPAAAVFERPVAARVLAEFDRGVLGLALEASFTARRDAETISSSSGVGLPQAVGLASGGRDPLLLSTDLFLEFKALTRPVVEELGSWPTPRPLGIDALEAWIRANLREGGPLGYRQLLERIPAGGTVEELHLARRAYLQVAFRAISESEVPCADSLAGLAAIGAAVVGGAGPDPADMAAELLKVQAIEIRRCREQVSPEEVVAANAVLARLFARRDRLTARERERISEGVRLYRMPTELIYRNFPRELLPLVEAMEKLLG